MAGLPVTARPGGGLAQPWRPGPRGGPSGRDKLLKWSVFSRVFRALPRMREGRPTQLQASHGSVTCLRNPRGHPPARGVRPCVLSAPGPPGEERAEDDERVDVSETASISASIAERYAQALFELAREGDDLASLEADADALAAALDASEDLRKVIASPRVTRDEMTATVAALAGPLGLSKMTANTLGLMAGKRRLFTLPQFVAKLRGMIAAEKGEVEAQVTSAVALTDEQKTRIADLLRVRFGRNIKLNTSVDESLIGGLIVKVGSKMIDTSIRAKLANLQNAMKEVG